MEIKHYFKRKSWMKSLYTNWECDLEISWSNFKTIYWSFLCSIIVPTYLLKHPIKAWTILELSNITESAAFMSLLNSAHIVNKNRWSSVFASKWPSNLQKCDSMLAEFCSNISLKAADLDKNVSFASKI